MRVQAVKINMFETAMPFNPTTT